MTSSANTHPSPAHRLRPALVALVGLSATWLVLGAAAPAEATFPGTTGLIAYERGGHIYLKSTTSGSDVDGFRVTQGYEPDWSPDGRKLAFVRNGDIHTINVDGTAERRLTDSQRNSAPAWSANQRRIAFTYLANDDLDFPIDLDNGYEHDVHVVNAADGSDERSVASSSDDEYDPTWSPDGAKIAYAHRRRCFYCSGWDYGIFVRRSDLTSGADRLGGAWREFVAHPDYSPDGTKLAYDGAQGTIRVQTLGRAGSQLLGPGRHPSFAPDATKMLVQQGLLTFLRPAASEYPQRDVAYGNSADWGMFRGWDAIAPSEPLFSSPKG